MDDGQSFRRPTQFRPGTPERLEVYCLRYENDLPIDMAGDLKLDDVLKRESLQNSTCLFHDEEEISELVDFSSISRNREVPKSNPTDVDLPCPYMIYD